FYHAVASDNLEVVKLFIGSGFTIDKESDSGLLGMVAAKGNNPLFSYLIELGLKPDGRDSLRNTPLMMAASRGHDSIVEMLLKMEVNTKTRNRDCDTAEELAMRAGFHEIASNISKSGSSGFLGGF
ncbi:MAG: ankyrin repeat domain-containing protein, partial [gamma proteobacterium symbiont of Bathyaustriella thionipta]|nr:ankyrin repeat domain-containing protein [gamma proteobacterium symbiont of Bathyaustriella thionipta]